MSKWTFIVENRNDGTGGGQCRNITKPLGVSKTSLMKN